MREEFDEMLRRIETGAFVYVTPSRTMLEFNDYLASRGYSVARMETVKMEGSQTGFRLDYHILANPSDEEIWDIFLDPERSRTYVKGMVDETIMEGGVFKFLVWAEKP
jgi:hypothetical protein